MADSNPSGNRWKYLSFALMGILAIGVTTPSASAAATDISKTVLDILKNTQTLMTQSDSISTTTSATQAAVSDGQTGLPGIQTKLDNLQGQLDQVQNAAFTKVVEKGFRLGSSNTSDRIFCDSDKPFIVHVSASDKGTAEGNRFDLIILPDIHDDDTPLDGVQLFNIGTEGFSQTMGGNGDQQFELFAIAGAGHAVSGIITMQTAEGATASCTVSE